MKGLMSFNSYKRASFQPHASQTYHQQSASLYQSNLIHS